MINTIVKANELFEGITSEVYHATSTFAALEIVKQNRFKLATSVGTDHERTMQTKPYFFSVTRSKVGKYTEKMTMEGTVFVLDGQALSHTYSGKAVDYWQWGHDSYEAEDRIYSETPYIEPASRYIKEVHTFHTDRFSQSNPEGPRAARYRKLAVACKTRGIPFYFYTDYKAWLLQNKRKAEPLSAYTKQARSTEVSRPYLTDRKRWSRPWLELYYKDDLSQLSKEAKQTRDLIVHQDYRGDSWKRLANDLHNNKTQPETGVANIIKIMRKEKLKHIEEFVSYLKDKWTEKS